MGSVSDKAANLLRAREAFLTSGELDGHVRELILNSWRRSRFWGVPVEQGETPYRDDINVDSRLVAAAQPVLDRLEREMADARMSVILTDAHAWVLDRRAGERSLNSYLDKVLLAPGFSYSEQHIGTNGIGTALEEKCPSHVFGHEHFVERLQTLSCAGAPIRDPLSGRVVGLVDVTYPSSLDWRPHDEVEVVSVARTAEVQSTEAVKKAAPLLYPGTTAVVLGAGGLGHIGIQALAALTPATIVVVDPSAPALELAKQLGAHHTIQTGDDHLQQALELTGGNGAEVVVDFVGERGAQADAWQMTRRGGSHFVVGYGSRVEVETIDLISTERNIVGNLVGSYNDLAELMTLAAQGKVTLHTRTYPLDQVNQAMDDLDHGRLQGRGILVP